MPCRVGFEDADREADLDWPTEIIGFCQLRRAQLALR